MVQDALFLAGRVSATLPSEDRGVAQSLLSGGLESRAWVLLRWALGGNAEGGF